MRGRGGGAGEARDGDRRKAGENGRRKKDETVSGVFFRSMIIIIDNFSNPLSREVVHLVTESR